jgi:hypothetical protein
MEFAQNLIDDCDYMRKLFIALSQVDSAMNQYRTIEWVSPTYVKGKVVPVIK